MTDLPFAPASERNKRPILECLLKVLPRCGSLLEIGAGTGQHAVFFARHFPGLHWQVTDRASEIPSLAARLQREGSVNLSPPMPLDVLDDAWPDREFAAAYSANTAHIMSWPAVCAMFAGVGRCLAEGAPFCLYGPFNLDGRFTAPSNEEFDRQLQAGDPAMGLRDVGALEKLSRRQQMKLDQRLDMPANNMLLVFRKTGS